MLRRPFTNLANARVRHQGIAGQAVDAQPERHHVILTEDLARVHGPSGIRDVPH